MSDRGYTHKHTWRRDDANWHLASPMVKNRVPRALGPWLFGVDSLTLRLRSHCDKGFSVRLLDQRWVTPLSSEARVLGLPEGRYAFVRQVQLLCGDRPWVYARTVIPLPVALGRLRGLTHLGTRPLGEVLFSNRSMRRGPIEVAKIAPDSTLSQVAHGGTNQHPETIWGRRSVFHLYNLPLLVSEIFLSEFPA